ncbi:alcohol dehydrogenase catalytic domain-containing protein [Pseudarthrobacter sp. J75]|uniref:alcohol dehydrogenase catalytic domain-containing protein n=1 Tax=unclassified Pseudarthrobacter TaxID=2647000 RepID=UPI002E814A1E|nr:MULTISPECIES: alcohol dehydrogenase catalytic domain-containing protein [unclassified Pseudarthrobacter]MEE2522803.1 alcohol dehydrogenase catalytic domain-containing protein [Pseudarthrobacter sp. J47]MEE2529664.1 alcohol dehydrogenase catalytic domain-containing protein [Pseudarthrobacter sp. J75]
MPETLTIRGAVLETMDAARPYAESTPITISEMELGAPGDGELLLKIEAAGICHSDLSVVDGNRARPLPMLLGHEAAGRIEAIGPGVEGLTVGDRVVLAFLPRCGECSACQTDGIMPCSVGSKANEAGELLGGGSRLSRHGEHINHHLGVSGFATRAVVDHRSVTRVDDDVPPEVAAVLGCAVLTGGGAVINAGKPKPGQRVAVVGLGGVGMAAFLVALAQDGVTVIGVDGMPEKLELAREWGAAEVYTPQEVTVQGITADVVIEAAGNARAFETAVDMTAPGGRMVSVGLPAPDARSSISPLKMVAQAKTIIGSYLGSAVPARDIPTFAQWWREGKLPVEKLITAKITLDQVNEAMDALADGKSVRQVIMF